MKIVAALAAAASLTFTLPAVAKSRSATAALPRLPDTTEAIVTTEVRAAQKTDLFDRIVAKRLLKEREPAEAIAKVKKVCKIDPTTAIEDALLAVTKDGEGGGFIALGGVDEPKAVACVVALAKDDSGKNVRAEKVTSKADGTIYKVTVEGGDEHFFGWLPDSILVVGSKPKDKAQLEGLLSGKGALSTRSKLAPRLSRLNPLAIFSAVMVKEQKVEGKTITGLDATIDVKARQVQVNATVSFKSADDAKELAKLVSSLKGMLSGMGNLSLDAKASGADLVLRADAPEDELIKVLDDALPKKRR